MRLATHAVEVDEVEVGRHAEQYVSWDLDTNLAERGVFWRLPVYVLGHEEQATDLTVYRWRRVAAVVFLVDLHDAILGGCQDFVEVWFPAIAVDPDAGRDVAATAPADSHIIKTPKIVERQLCCHCTKNKKTV